MLFHLPDTILITTYLRRLPQEVLDSDYIKFSIEAYVAKKRNNGAKFFDLIRNRATYLQSCLLFPFIVEMRVNYVSVIAKALRPVMRGHQEAPHSVTKLQELLMFEDSQDVCEFLEHCGFEVLSDGDQEEGGAYIVLAGQDLEDNMPVSQKDGVTPIM